jgi:AraC-like DNA-binding protein
MNFILNIGFILSFFLGIVLFSKKNKSLSDKILALWLFVIGTHLLSYFIYTQGYWEEYPHLIGVTVPFPFLHGPFLYLYVLYSFKSQKNLQKLDYLHFVPFLISYLYMLPFYFGYTSYEKIQVDKGLVEDYSTFSNVLLIGFIVSGISYVFLTYRKLIQHKRLIDDNFSLHNRIKLNWLKYSILCFLGMFLTAAIIIVMREILLYQFPFNADLIFYSFIVLFVIFIGFSGIRQQNLFSNNLSDENLLVKNKKEGEYKKSGLKSDTAKSKHDDLLKFMKTEKPYLNPKLTLSELAGSLNISANHLSQIINQYEKVNFHDFINTYRVNEFIERAENNNNLNYLSIAFESGFNSKSAFNSIFKKIKDSTPSQYLAKTKN